MLCLRRPARALLPSCWLRSFAVESGLGSIYLPFELGLLTLRFSTDFLVARPRSLSLSRRSASSAVHSVGLESWRLAEMEKCQHTPVSTIHYAIVGGTAIFQRFVPGLRTQCLFSRIWQSLASASRSAEGLLSPAVHCDGFEPWLATC